MFFWHLEALLQLNSNEFFWLFYLNDISSFCMYVYTEVITKEGIVE